MEDKEKVSMKVGDRFKTTATLEHCSTGGDIFGHFEVHPKHKMLWGVGQNVPVYVVEFEIAEINPPYPKEEDVQKVEYWGYLMEGHDRVSLIQGNVILFSIQFPSPVFDYSEAHLKLGTVYKLNLIGAQKLKENGTDSY